jgi:hypothetical protein
LLCYFQAKPLLGKGLMRKRQTVRFIWVKLAYSNDPTIFYRVFTWQVR